MEYMNWNNQTLTVAEWIPICILVLEALLGVACNLVAAVTYSKQTQRLFNNPGNTFTVSLMIDDLVLSGIAIPLVIATETLKTSESTTLMNYLCLGARCTVLFSAVSSASGNALLALDRGDITLRPSKRFFRKKRVTAALIIARLLSIMALSITLVTSWRCREKTEESRVVYADGESFFLLGKIRHGNGESFNNSFLKDIQECNATCSSNHCSVNEMEFKIRSAIQTVFFTCAAIIIIATYTKILQSVKRRDVKRASKNVEFNAGLYSSNKKTKMYLNRWCGCWKANKNDILLATNNNNNNNNDKPKNENSSHASLNAELHASPASKSTTDSLKEELTQQKSEENFEVDSPNISNERSAGIHPGRARFASVALSVQAFIALKRIVKEKMEIKRRKHRHLQRMTIAITLTFLLCWMPFHILPYVTLSTGQFQKSLTCKLNFCDRGKEVKKPVLFTEPNFPLNVLFLWSFVLVSTSSIANPCLYSFSREKIRNEFSRIFCKSKNLNVALNSGNVGKKPTTKLSSNKKPINTKAVLKLKKYNCSNSRVQLQKSSNFIDEQNCFKKSPASTTQKLIQNDPILSAETLTPENIPENFNLA